MQQEFTIGKAYYLYLDTPYCDKWLSRKTEKKKERERDENWTTLALAFNSAWDFELQYVEPSLSRGVSKRGVWVGTLGGGGGGVGSIFLLKNAFLGIGLGLRVRVKVRVRVRVRVKDMLGLGLVALSWLLLRPFWRYVHYRKWSCEKLRNGMDLSLTLEQEWAATLTM